MTNKQKQEKHKETDRKQLENTDSESELPIHLEADSATDEIKTDGSDTAVASLRKQSADSQNASLKKPDNLYYRVCENAGKTETKTQIKEFPTDNTGKLWHIIQNSLFAGRHLSNTLANELPKIEILIANADRFKDDRNLRNFIARNIHEGYKVQQLSAYFHRLQSIGQYELFSEQANSVNNIGPIDHVDLIQSEFFKYFRFVFNESDDETCNYEEIFQQIEIVKALFLSLDIHYFSTVIGDGSCYYRSIYVNYMQQVLIAAPEVRELALRQLARNIEDLEQPQMFAPLIEKLYQAANGECWNHLAEFHGDILFSQDRPDILQYSYDSLFVFALRYHNVLIIDNNIDMLCYEDGLTMKQMIQFSSHDKTTSPEENLQELSENQEFKLIRNYLDKHSGLENKEYVSDWVVQLGFVSLLLPGCHVDNYKLNKDAVTKADKWDKLAELSVSEGFEPVNFTIQVRILNVPNHYIMLYDEKVALEIKESCLTRPAPTNRLAFDLFQQEKTDSEVSSLQTNPGGP